jgi:tetratricopeptide (TPR) repeat protein
MATLSWITRVPIFAVACLLACANSYSQTQTPLFDSVHTVATSTQGVPVEETFTITAAGNYKVTLVDLGALLTPSAPLASVELAITNGGTIVGTPLTAAGSAQFAATAGTYVIHVVGAPSTSKDTNGNTVLTAGSGPIGIQVTNTADSSQIAAFSDTLAFPPTATLPNVGVLSDTFTVPASGDYVVTLSDLQLPAALTQLTLAIAVQGGGLVTDPTFATTPTNPTATTTVTLQSGVTYSIFAGGQAAGAVNAGLYGVNVSASGGGGPLVYSHTTPVGAVQLVSSPTLTAASYTLGLADLAFPSALTQMGAAVTYQGQSVAQLTATGHKALTGTADTYQVFAFGVAGSTGQGSYAVTLQPPSGAAVLSVARAVSPLAGPGYAYSFDTTVVGGEVYALTSADFGFPAKLTSISAAAVQNGAVLGSPLSAAGTQNNIIPATGPVTLLVFAQPAPSSGGLFGLNLIAGGAGTAAFATTQGVGAGQLFSTSKVTVTAGGTYQVTVSDVGFPATFANLAVVVTQGATIAGSIYNAGTFNFPATGGDYYLSFIAQPQAAAQAGTYEIAVGPQPPAPTLTFQSSAPSVATGTTVTLQWSSTNVTSCTASGGWSGTQPTSGQATTAALSADTTFTLTCTGSGQTVTKSVTVSITAAPHSGGHGGGGAIRLDVVALLFGLVVLRVITSLFATVPWGRAAVLAGVLVIAGCGGAASRLENHLQRGRTFFDKGDYTHASIEFRNAMQIAPKDIQARLLAAGAAEKLGQFREAFALYQSIVDAPNEKPADKQTEAQNLEARASLARLMVFGGQAEKALQTVEPGLAKHPDDVPLLIVRATARSKTKNDSGALADVERALKLAPTNEGAIALRAGMYRRTGEVPKAIEFVSKALEQAPRSADLHEILAGLYAAENDTVKVEEQLRFLVQLEPQVLSYRTQLAVFYMRANRLDDAQGVLDAAVKAMPQNPEAKLTLVKFISTQRTREQGEKILRGFIAQEPKNYDLRFGLADLLQRAGATRDALATYEEIVRLDDMGPKAMMARDHIAAIDLAQGRDSDASKLVGVVLQKNPRDNDALLVRAQIELKHQDSTAAVGDLRALLRDQPNSAEINRLLGRAYMANGEPSLAEQALHAAVDAAPRDTGIRIELAQLLLRTGRADQSVAMLEEAVRNAPADAQLREVLVRAYVAKSDFVAARGAADDLKTLRPDSAAGFYLAGLIAQAQQRPDDAQKEFERALALQPKAFDALLALARLDLARGRGDQAVVLVKDAVARNPDNALAMSLLGEIYLEQKNLPLALETLNAAIKLAPTWWSGYRDLAMAKLTANDTDGAIAAYEAGIKVAPTEPRLPTELAQLYERRSRVDDAINLYESWNKRAPGNRAITNNLAMLLVTYKKDRASLDRARELTAGFESTNDGTLLDTNGWVHFKRSEYADALPVLERAAERAPNSKEIRYHLGMAELHAGQSARARSDLEMAVSGSQDTMWSNDARAVLAGLKDHAG